MPSGAETRGDDPRLRFHDLRHTFASLLIAEGLDAVFVSCQLGHASTSVTLDVYAHLFNRKSHAERVRAALEDSIGKVLEEAVDPAEEDVAASGGEAVALQVDGINGDRGAPLRPL